MSPKIQLNGPFFTRFCETARARLQRSQELLAAGASANAAAIRIELYSLAAEAAVLGCTEVATLARQGEDAARRIVGDPASAVACARAVRALGRALDAVEVRPPQLEAPPPPLPPEAASARGHVLLVDDSRLNAELLALVLSEEGFAVEIASTAAELERSLATSRVDVTLSDVNMPELDVAVVCRRVREVAPRARMLLVSGLAEDALARECVRLRADGYLTRAHGLGDVVERVIAETAGRSA